MLFCVRNWFISEVLESWTGFLGSWPCRDPNSQETSGFCLVYVLTSGIATCTWSASEADVTLTFGAALRIWLQFCSPCCGDMLHSAKTRTYSGTHVKKNPGFPLRCRGIQLSRASVTGTLTDPNNQAWPLPPVKAHLLVELGHRRRHRQDSVAGVRLLVFGLNVRGFKRQSLGRGLYRGLANRGWWNEN